MKIGQKYEIKFFRLKLHFQGNNVSTCLIRNWYGTVPRYIFKFIFLENEASYETILFYISDLFSTILTISIPIFTIFY